MRKPNLIFCAILSLGVFLVGCKKDVKELVEDTTSMVNMATDYSAAENAFEDIFDLVDEEAKQQGDLNGFVQEEEAQSRGCAEVVVTPTMPGIFPVTMTLAFDGSCTLSDGRTVSGTITAVYTGKVREAGTSVSITFDNLVIDGNTINGTQTITNNGMNSLGQLNFSIVVNDGKITYSDGTEIKYETNRMRTWVEGMDTNFENNGVEGLKDDVWEITGTASGLNRDGNTFDGTISTALRREMDCRWLTAGVLEIETDIFDNTVVIDYGDGTCDGKANITVGAFQREITLK